MVSHCGFDFFFFFLIKLFIHLFLAAFGLCCCLWASSSCGEWGLLFIAVRGLLITVDSLCCGAPALGARAAVGVARGLSSCGLWALEPGSVVVVHGLSCSAACGIFPDQGLNLCPLPWQADS